MMPPNHFLASITVDAQTLSQPWTLITSAFSGKGLFFWTLLAVVGAIVAWAIFIRKPKDDRQRRHHWRDQRRDSHRSHHKSWRLFGHGGRRRKKRRPRNPTLAETGGLPPPRSPDLPPPEI